VDHLVFMICSHRDLGWLKQTLHLPIRREGPDRRGS
jgi:hypothetical protein